VKYLLIAASFLLASTSVLATGGGLSGTTNNFGGNAWSGSSAHALGLGVGTGYGGAGGSGFGGNASLNTPGFASMAYAPPAYPTATCLKAYSGGGSWIGAGFSAGVTVVDTECRIFEGMRAIVNSLNNGFMTTVVNGETVAERMHMDIACEADTLKNTRDCKAHNAMRAEDDLDYATPSQAANNPHDGPERKFSLFGLFD